MISAVEAPSERNNGARIAAVLQRFGTLAIFLTLVVVATFWSDAFLTTGNILNVLRQVASGAGIMTATRSEKTATPVRPKKCAQGESAGSGSTAPVPRSRWWETASATR